MVNTINNNIYIIFNQDYQAIVDAEWTILYEKLDKISNSGAKVVLSKLPIGDVATQYFADRLVIVIFFNIIIIIVMKVLYYIFLSKNIYYNM